MEILTPNRYDEYERFVSGHPMGSFMQSPAWHGVKSNWGMEIVVARNEDGNITAGAVLLIRRLPVIGVSLMYAPRGPVCDPNDRETLGRLMSGVHAAAKKHRAYMLKADPNVLMSDGEFLKTASELGFKHNVSGVGFEAVQARFNYRLYIGGMSEDQVFASFAQKTRYNIRVAIKHNVEVRVVGKEHLPDFVRLMNITGMRDGFRVRPGEYFERILDSLGEYARLYMAFYNENAVSGAICVNYAGKTNYVYGASDNDNRNVMPNYLLQWEMIRWAVSTGCQVYDLQGVSGNLDESNPLFGLYRFKKGFNGRLDELAGEFDYVYKPVLAKLIDCALAIRDKLLSLKRRLLKK